MGSGGSDRRQMKIPICSREESALGEMGSGKLETGKMSWTSCREHATWAVHEKARNSRLRLVAQRAGGKHVWWAQACVDGGWLRVW